jgi:hypothetical protein
MRDWEVRVVLVGAAVLLSGGSFLAGRLAGGHQGARPPGVDTASGAAASCFADGVRAGEQLGLQEGRALQEAASVPPGAGPSVTEAFTDGYTAGANDVFGGYDGGWRLGASYVITLERGHGAVTYRIASRREAR